MPIEIFTRPARRFLADRLDRLHDALLALSGRLRQTIAGVVGDHVGDAVRAAVQAVLEHHSIDAPPRPSGNRDTFLDDEEVPYEMGDQPWHSGAPHPCPTSSIHPRAAFGMYDDVEHTPITIPPTPTYQPRWLTFLPPAVQAIGYWLKHRPTRMPVLAALCVGTAAGVIALTAGPIIGGLAAVAGTVLITTRLADDVHDVFGSLKGVTSR